VQADTGVALGKILLMVGAVDEATLADTLVLKVAEALADSISWAEGTFQFEPDEAGRSVSEFEISLNLPAAIGAALDEKARRRALRERFPNDDVRFFIKETTAVEGVEIPGLIDAISLGTSLGQLVLANHGQRYLVGAALIDLLDRGAIGIDRRGPTRPADLREPEQLQGAARGRAAGGDRAGALALVSRALVDDPDNEETLALHRELERSLFAELSRDLLGEFRVPKLLKSRKELDGLELSDAERYLAGRIDGRWDLLSLLRVAPLREVDALLTFKRLADRGIISL
jgi:hypothetical protein